MPLHPSRSRRRRSQTTLESQPGHIYWLPAKDQITPDLLTDLEIEDGCFNHPVIVLFGDSTEQKATILILTSFDGCELAQKHPHDFSVRERYLPIFPSAAHPDNGILLRLRRGRTQLRKKSYIVTEPQYIVDVALLVPYDAAGSGRIYKLNLDSYTLLVGYVQRRDSASRRPSQRENRARRRRHPPRQHIQPTSPSSVDPLIPLHTPVQRLYHTPPPRIPSIRTWAQSASRAPLQEHIPPLPLPIPISSRSTLDRDAYKILRRERLEASQSYSHAPPSSEPKPDRPMAVDILKSLIFYGVVLYGSYWAWRLSRKRILKTIKDFCKALPGEGSPRALLNVLARSPFTMSLGSFLNDRVKPFLAESLRYLRGSILPFFQRSASYFKNFVVSSSTRESLLPLFEESAHAFKDTAVPFFQDSIASLKNSFERLLC